MGRVTGIDLGTYFSSVATMVGEKAECVRNKDGTMSMHSVVSFPSEKETLVGNISYECSFLYANETVKEVKRIMGKEATAITVRGTSYSPQQISAMILKSLCADVEREFDEPVEKAVITIPAAFDSTQRKATFEAAKIAGIEVLALAEEPLAALAANGNLADYAGQCVSVIDIGGGTSDGCTVEVKKDENGKIILNCICIAGDTHLGGGDFDRALYKFIQKRDLVGISLNAEERVELEAKCEAAKRKLSEKQEAEFKMMIAGKRKKIHITREKFEEAAAEEFGRIQKFLNEMKEYRIPDHIILCGGSTRIPKVETLIKKTFKNIPVGGENRDLAVAEGAAILAQMYVNDAEQAVFKKNINEKKAGNGQTDKNDLGQNRSNHDSAEMDMIPVKVNMVCSKSYGIAAFTPAGKKMVCNMIYRNEPLPIVRESNCFAIRNDHSSACTLCVYESTGTEAHMEFDKATEIGKCILKINGDLLAGTPLFVRLEVGTDSILHITGREKTGNTEVTAEFKITALMSNDEIETAKQLVEDVYAKVV